MNNSWIKLSKEIVYWEWFKDNNTFKLFIYCILKANWKDSKFEGIEVKRGSFVTSLKKLSEETGLSIQNVRTSLKKLNSTQELTQQAHGKFTILSVKNYNLYQEANMMSNTELTQGQHGTNTQVTTIEEYKNNKVCVNNTAHTRKKNFCHLGAKEKNEVCKDCKKNSKCRHKTSSEFLYKYGCSFEEWNKKRLDSYKKWYQERKANNQPVNIEDFDYDWLNEVG